MIPNTPIVAVPRMSARLPPAPKFTCRMPNSVGATLIVPVLAITLITAPLVGGTDVGSSGESKFIVPVLPRILIVCGWSVAKLNIGILARDNVPELEWIFAIT